MALHRLFCTLFPLLAMSLSSSLTSFADALSSPTKSPRSASPQYTRFVEKLPSMEGKNVVITGCSRGLGYVTAKVLVEKGAMVYMLNRKKDEALVEKLHQVNKNAPTPMIIPCDLLDFTSVRNAAAELKTHLNDNNTNMIDVLCNNAGIMLQPDEASVDGYDITASTNVLSHFLLTKELYQNKLLLSSEKSAPRIVNMSSMSGYGPSPFDPRYFQKRGGNCGGSKKKAASYERYHQSKLGNLLFTAALNDRFSSLLLAERGGDDETTIQALACTPGVCGTDMFLHATKTMMGKASSLENVPSPEDGSMAQLKCICDPTVVSGDLWGPAMRRPGGNDNDDDNDDNDFLVKTPMEPPQIFVDDASKDLFWSVCEDAVGKFEI